MATAKKDAPQELLDRVINLIDEDEGHREHLFDRIIERGFPARGADGVFRRGSPEEDERLRLLPGAMQQLEGVDDASATDLVELADRLFRNAWGRLGRDGSESRLGSFFRATAGTPPAVTARLNDEVREPDRVEKVARLDEAWDRQYATAVNAFHQARTNAEATIRDAADDWQLAVRLYEAKRRSAGAVLRNVIDTADADRVTHEGQKQLGADEQVNFRARSSKIAAGLVAHERAVAAATAELSTAFGVAVKNLMDSSAKVEVAAATMIAAKESASLAFWTGVHADLTSRS